MHLPMRRGAGYRPVSNPDENHRALKLASEQLKGEGVTITQRNLCERASKLWPLTPAGFSNHVARYLSVEEKAELGLKEEKAAP